MANMQRFQFDFMKYRAGFGWLSIITTIVSIVLILAPGLKYGIDFAGGTNIMLSFNSDVTDAEVRKVIEESGIADPSVQHLGDASSRQYLVQTGAVTTVAKDKLDAMKAAVAAAYGAEATFDYNETSGDRIYIRLGETPYGNLFEAGSGAPDPAAVTLSGKATELAAALQTTLAPAAGETITVSPFGGISDRKFLVQLQSMQTAIEGGLRKAFGDKFKSVDKVETVGPRVGAQLRSDAIKSALVALLGILIYVALRFDMRYAPGAVLSLAHDSLILLGVLIILGKEFNLVILAAVLTLIGYSLNDTIVNFDRIRENLNQKTKETLPALINRSINEVLSRTIITSMTTVLATTAIYLVGGGLVRDFAFAMLFGVIFGTYSSIYVSNSLMLWTTEWFDKRAASRPPQVITETANLL
ncbi:MAG: protein translocase subunit SecF [Deltaproteobacteria bacterium]|nr:protein translocase subunit SecF [Deltaproteobacteria bacterium]